MWLEPIMASGFPGPKTCLPKSGGRIPISIEFFIPLMEIVTLQRFVEKMPQIGEQSSILDTGLSPRR